MLRLTPVRLAMTGFMVAAIASSYACGSNSPVSPSPTPGTSADVTITINGQRGNESYSPASVTVRVGQRVAWRNTDSDTHTATADNGSFDTGNLSGNATSSPITMTAAGTFGYFCRPHPSMRGTLIVTP